MPRVFARVGRCLLVLAAVSSVGLGCDDLFLEEAASPGIRKPVDTSNPTVPVGLDEIRDRGTLRLLTRNNGHTYYVLRGRRLGFDYVLAERLARSLDVKLEVIVPENWSDMISMLRNGQGDIVGAAMNITPARREQVLFANPYGLSHMRVVWGPGRERVRSVDDLSGRQVHARENSTYYTLLNRLSALYVSVGRKPVDIVIESETLETELILGDVADGKVFYSLCDHHICLSAKEAYPSLVIGPVVSDLQPLAWAVHPRAADLKVAIDDFFAAQRKKDFRRLYDLYYPSVAGSVARASAAQVRGGKISPYDRIFKEAVKGVPIDWRLLAAIAFEESRFNAKAQTRYGGRGLFGVLPRDEKTAGVTDSTDPKQASRAAARQLGRLLKIFASVPIEEDRLKFVLGAYHSGFDHIEDAQRIAASRDGQVQVWADVARALPLLSLSQYSARAQHGYLRGSVTVRYVDTVWEHYRTYRQSPGDRR